MFRVLAVGWGLWIFGTVAVRLVGPLLLPYTLALYAASFVAMAFLARGIFRLLHVPRADWPKAVTLLVLPTLVLDPFSCAYFRSVFPNVAPSLAGAFGGWMLICCGGAVGGAWWRNA